MTETAAPIGVFDSGVGGLTVARAIMDQLPAESIRYLGDTANSPYGPQPIAEVRAHALAAMDQLVQSGVKMLVVACNSASSACLRDARERYDVPVVEVILPAVRRAIAATRTGNVGVIGTQTTVRSRAYDDAFAAAPQVTITSAACPSFVDFVERGITSGRQILGLAQSYLEPLQRAEVDTLVLGCTHYPLLTGAISHVMGDGVTLVSSAEETAKDVFRVLTDEGLLRDSGDPPGEAVPLGEHRFFSTGDADTFHRLAERFLGPAVGPIATLPVGRTASRAAEDTETPVAADAAPPPDTAPGGRAVPVPGQYSADRIPVPNLGALQCD
ncbi:MAG: glutamate racemase [Geodermatophilaceae bacterium]|nr:glutamate racemase [Geodermatophilaceae bacterium]